MRALLIGAALVATMVVSGKKFEPMDLVQIPRPGEAVVSPSGRLAAYAQSTYHVDKAKWTRNILLLDLESSAVSSLTEPSFDVSQMEPFFLDDDHIAFLQHTANETVDQLYVKRIQGDQEPYPLTDFPIEFSSVKYNPEKKLLAFSASVYLDAPTLDTTQARDEEIKGTKRDSGLLFDKFPIRIWDQFTSIKKNNVFVVDLGIKNAKYQLEGKPRNLLTGTNLECPEAIIGDSSYYDISPDGNEIAFVSTVHAKADPWKFTKQIYIVPTSGKVKPVAINNDTPGASSSPKYSPSGILAYTQAYDPLNEACLLRIVLYNRQYDQRKVLVPHWDRSPNEIVFSADSDKIFAIAEDRGRFKVFAIHIATEHIETLTMDHFSSGLTALPSNMLLFNVNSMNSPNIIHTLNLTSGELRPYNPDPVLVGALNAIDMVEPEEFEFTGALDDQVHGWILKPVDFDSSKKYPVAFLIHGGPQSSWSDSWSTRWNYQIYPAAGFVTIAINFHGSTGYGKKFCSDIQYNWGSHPYHDLMNGLDYVFQTYDFLDADHLVGLGGSFGGYMVNWLNSHTDRFKAFVNHDGLFSLTSFYYGSDEANNLDIEFGGSPFHPLSRAIYERWSPSNFVQNWKTPTLVIQGGRDYRVPETESIGTYVALQHRGIPCRLLYFPDENHWVLNPENSLRWHKEVLQWINQWIETENTSTLVIQETSVLFEH